jgi:hypothetical protein
MITCKNRKLQTYYLKVGTTKTGKPRYYASMNAEKGDNASAMPEGYAFTENINGQVSVGKPKASPIEASEFDLVMAQVEKLDCNCRAEIKENTIVLHTANEPMLMDEHPFMHTARLKEYHTRNAYYQAMLRFILVDKKSRLFQSERMCFRGETRWIWMSSPAPLKKVAAKYIPLLDDEEALFAEYF